MNHLPRTHHLLTVVDSRHMTSTAAVDHHVESNVPLNNRSSQHNHDDKERQATVDLLIQNMNATCSSLRDQLLFIAKIDESDDISLQLYEQLLLSATVATPSSPTSESDLAPNSPSATGNRHKQGHSKDKEHETDHSVDSTFDTATDEVSSNTTSSVPPLFSSGTTIVHKKIESLLEPFKPSWGSTSGSTFKIEDVRDKDNNDCTLMHLLAQKNKVLCMDYLYRYRGARNIN